LRIEFGTRTLDLASYGQYDIEVQHSCLNGLELVEGAKLTCNMSLRAHVSSENGRLDIMRCLQDEFIATKEKAAGTCGKAWVYGSGPAGLASQLKNACVDVKAKLRQARKKREDPELTMLGSTCYIPEWEV